MAAGYCLLHRWEQGWVQLDFPPWQLQDHSEKLPQRQELLLLHSLRLQGQQPHLEMLLSWSELWETLTGLLMPKLRCVQ